MEHPFITGFWFSAGVAAFIAVAVIIVLVITGISEVLGADAKIAAATESPKINVKDNVN